MMSPVVGSLEEVTGETVTEVLPALQNLFLEGGQVSSLVQEDIDQLVNTRRISGHPVVVQSERTCWITDVDE
jgi:predicted component of type VI protein secretion system